MIRWSHLIDAIPYQPGTTARSGKPCAALSGSPFIAKASGTWWLGDGAVVSAFENDLKGIVRHIGALQQVAQPHSSPLRVADSAEFPLHTFNFRNKENATVTSALQRGRDRLRRHLAQLTHRHLEWSADLAIYFQTPIAFVDFRDREVATNVKSLAWRNKTVEGAERHLEIQRFFLPHDHGRN